MLMVGVVEVCACVEDFWPMPNSNDELTEDCHGWLHRKKPTAIELGLDPKQGLDKTGSSTS